jgi:enoyl-CoA hydratase
MDGYELPDEVQVTADEAVRVVTLNRPERLNAFNQAMHDGIIDVWRQLALDRDARSVVLTGAGPGFSAGADINWLMQQHADPGKAPARIEATHELAQAMLRFPLPVVAAINGPAVGLGCSLTVFSDLVLMAESAYLSDPHVSVGLAPGDGGAYWPLLTGMHRVKEYLFLGRRISADDALGLGLANRVVADEDLQSEALKLARRLASQPPQAIRDTKRVLNAYMTSNAHPAAEVALLAERVGMLSTEHAAQLSKLLANHAD